MINRKWVEELVAAKDSAESDESESLKRENKEAKEGLRCGASDWNCFVKIWAVTDMLSCYYICDS